jgi:hypothetical protein
VRAVLDTNAVICEAFFGGAPDALFGAALDGRLLVVMTPKILDEGSCPKPPREQVSP